MYAHDFSRWGDVVTQCIEAHIRRVSDLLLSIGSLLLEHVCSSDGLEDGVAISSRVVLSLVLLYLYL
jgi:hypothetical protein